MPPHLEIANRLYAAFRARDARTIAELLHADFAGEVTAGLPLGLGGSYHGPRAMLEGVWGRVGEYFDITPEPAQMLEAAPEHLVVIGHYRGHAHATGVPVEAAFAHVLRFREGRISELRQITDSKRWHEALDGATTRN